MLRSHFAIVETRSCILPPNMLLQLPFPLLSLRRYTVCAQLLCSIRRIHPPPAMQAFGLGNNQRLQHEELKPDSCLCNVKMKERRVMHTVKLSKTCLSPENEKPAFEEIGVAKGNKQWPLCPHTKQALQEGLWKRRLALSMPLIGFSYSKLHFRSHHITILQHYED
jgi:hypothetical protein